jgi:hypothetical protein
VWVCGLRDAAESETARSGMMKRPPPNNYFHVRVYTDDGAKIELWRDKKQPSTRREIIDGLKRAIDVLEKVEQAAAMTQKTP